jgi:hypothetical protein
VLKRVLAALAATLLVTIGFGVTAAPAQAVPCAPVCYFYNVGLQTFAAAPYPTGNYTSFTIPNPTIAAGDFHSLAEISIEITEGGQRQIVEVGWRKAAGDVVRLFVGHWVNGVFAGYNAGFTDYAPNSVDAGDALTVGATRKFGLVYSGSSWWVWEGTTGGVGDWVGYFPGTNWTGAAPAVTGFNKSTKTQVFGEVAAGNTPTCTDMGDGTHGSATAGALIGSYTNVGGPASSITVFETPAYAGYTEYARSSRTFAYGGPGC